MSTSPKAALLEEYALLAQALAPSSRLRILEPLAKSERGAERIAAKTGPSITNCAQHLQQLRRAGLVASRREGKAVICRLTDPRTAALMAMPHEVAEGNLARVGEILHGLAGGAEVPEPASRADLAARLSEGLAAILPLLEPGVEIVTCCRVPYCIHAHQAAAALRRMGRSARQLEGGLPDWRAEGRAVACL